MEFFETNDAAVLFFTAVIPAGTLLEWNHVHTYPHTPYISTYPTVSCCYSPVVQQYVIYAFFLFWLHRYHVIKYKAPMVRNTKYEGTKLRSTKQIPAGMSTYVLRCTLGQPETCSRPWAMFCCSCPSRATVLWDGKGRTPMLRPGRQSSVLLCTYQIRVWSALR